MRSDEPLAYTEDEIKSFLPSGWMLAGGRDASGRWNPKNSSWQATLIDNVEFDWPVVVKSWEASSLGRIEALRRAIDKVYRERLG